MNLELNVHIFHEDKCLAKIFVTCFLTNLNRNRDNLANTPHNYPMTNSFIYMKKFYVFSINVWYYWLAVTVAVFLDSYKITVQEEINSQNMVVTR